MTVETQSHSFRFQSCHPTYVSYKLKLSKEIEGRRNAGRYSVANSLGFCIIFIFFKEI